MPALRELLRLYHKPENPIPSLVGQLQDGINMVLGERSERFLEIPDKILVGQKNLGTDSFQHPIVRVGRGSAEGDILTLTVKDRDREQALIVQVVHGHPIFFRMGMTGQLGEDTKIAALEFGIYILSQLSKSRA